MNIEDAEDPLPASYNSASMNSAQIEESVSESISAAVRRVLHYKTLQLQVAIDLRNQVGHDLDTYSTHLALLVQQQQQQSSSSLPMDDQVDEARKKVSKIAESYTRHLADEDRLREEVEALQQKLNNPF
eukprot:CAMPEP_0116558760 /NCGR_PEP_ID=MMETSP0397-20121206/10001_1 /TAXON_ID=216820 /ORGANISM="Cyclophora tenuis, Strain ECT3854" /LENGTH=128 /DNA_ID=CAMNT_0004084417 /DNA_START=33 /DNA_END=419 /DNA_ORIENTATION=+